MKRRTLFCFVLASSLAVGQGIYRYSDKSENLQIVAPGGVAWRALANDAFELTLSGGKSKVTATSRTQGIQMTGGNIVATIGPDPAKKGQNRLQRARATGGTRTIKSANGQTSEIAGNTATYVAGVAESLLTLTGAVSLRNLDQQKRQSLAATGSSGIATLETGTQSKRSNGVRSATLAGPVRVTMIESGSRRATVVASANRMIYENTPGRPTITLTGNVKISGQGESNIGTFSNLSRAVLRLNDKNELVSFNTQ